MTRRWMLWSVAVLPFALAVVGCGDKQGEEQKEGAKQSPVERGRYIVTRVGMCIDCHSPWKEGHPDPEHPMAGSKLGFAPIGEVPGWQPSAPALVGVEDPSSEEIVRVLTTGLKDSGKPPRPPMPPYRMTKEDAEAVVAFLKTLKAP